MEDKIQKATQVGLCCLGALCGLLSGFGLFGCVAPYWLAIGLVVVAYGNNGVAQACRDIQDELGWLFDLWLPSWVFLLAGVCLCICLWPAALFALAYLLLTDGPP